MAQRSIEILIGRLLTDEAFREAFLMDPTTALKVFCDTGNDLTPLEISALLATRSDLWSEIASEIDPRLQKANLAKQKKEKPLSRME